MGLGTQNSPVESIPRASGIYYSSQFVYSLISKLAKSNKNSSVSGVIKYSHVSDFHKLPEQIVGSIDALVKSAVKQCSQDGSANPAYLRTAAAVRPTAYLGGTAHNQTELQTDYLGKGLEKRLGPTVPYVTAMVFTEKGGLDSYVSVDEMVRKRLLPIRSNQVQPWFVNCHKSEMDLYGIISKQSMCSDNQFDYKLPAEPKKYEKN